MGTITLKELMGIGDFQCRYKIAVIRNALKSLNPEKSGKMMTATYGLFCKQDIIFFELGLQPRLCATCTVY